MNRRDLLKMFGIGSAIVPLVGGMPSTDHTAIVVTPPKIEIPPPPVVVPVDQRLEPSKNAQITLFVKEYNGNVIRWDCSALEVEYEPEWIDVTNHSAPYLREYMPSIAATNIKVRGITRWAVTTVKS